jgi:hypothetical protein
LESGMDTPTLHIWPHAATPIADLYDFSF